MPIPEYILANPEVQAALHDLSEVKSKRERVLANANRDLETAVVRVNAAISKARFDHRRLMNELEALGISGQDAEVDV